MTYYRRHKDGTLHYHHYNYTSNDDRPSRMIRRAIVNHVIRKRLENQAKAHFAAHKADEVPHMSDIPKPSGSKMPLDTTNVSSKRMGEHEKIEPTIGKKSIAKTRTANSNVTPAPVAAAKPVSPTAHIANPKPKITRLRAAMNDNNKAAPKVNKPAPAPSSKPAQVFPPRIIHAPNKNLLPQKASVTHTPAATPAAAPAPTAPKVSSKPAQVFPPRIIHPPKLSVAPASTSPTVAPKKSIAKSKASVKAPAPVGIPKKPAAKAAPVVPKTPAPKKSIAKTKTASSSAPAPIGSPPKKSKTIKANNAVSGGATA